MKSLALPRQPVNQPTGKLALRTVYEQRLQAALFTTLHGTVRVNGMIDATPLSRA